MEYKYHCELCFYVLKGFRVVGGECFHSHKPLWSCEYNLFPSSVLKMSDFNQHNQMLKADVHVALFC